ncbi:UDP-N-acetylmuramoyl-tripeptide--D-alanyl-D-alanine ligase [Oceanobacter sp. 5_MG-2023]|uniref:UDP-N-acetylmuramoyl-tripeptide--D-alanyl-D- alanine ligase n=1 Tax=Oceanobacter sp. 5_MG-2023 TaxID=3062645 RepID=UPI0026E13371|nr:UDP-N-acetylmuramoyl-tripeptide--D-alanyl-D-alanine ligase [Oceanobacter sp. 5_MG-2023]MDO6682268.1 UDP-N-acetylmuramoyl-tripeptide--D-alanyl-D-alanine ligase [Oceanobacter sp. 5_MG-2023]
MRFDFNLSQVAALLGLATPAVDVRCTGVCTDTRQIQSGDLYVALRGEHFDGNRFASQALAAGAVAVLLDEVPPEALDGPCLICADGLLAYGQIAGWQRGAFYGPIVAITGSAGKTTTKQLMAKVLEQQFITWMTPGNLNNHIGVPKTLLALQPEHEAAVVELGASGPGEIDYTACLVKPTIGIITNAGAAHLEGFGSLAGVVQTKGELIDSVDANGIVVLNADDPAFAPWQTRAGNKQVVSFGLSASADLFASEVACRVDGSDFVVHSRHEGWSQHVCLAFPGQHNVSNALAVFAAARGLGMTPAMIAAGLQAAVPVAGRMKAVAGQNQWQIIDDSYNANPASIRAAIDVISLASGAWLVLGDMAELGEEAEQAHSDIGRYARQQGVSALVATGPLSRFTVAAFGDQGYWLPDRDGVVALIKQKMPDQTTVLVKGSRSAGMDSVVRALQLHSEE